MSVQATSAQSATSTDPRGETRLRGRRLILARIAWVALAALAMGLFIASLPTVFEQLRTVCSVSPCADGRLTPPDAQALRALGLSPGLYAIYGVAQHIVWASVWCLVGGVIFWRKSDDRMALVAGLMLVTTGATFTYAPQTLAEQEPALWLPVALVRTVSEACFLLFLYLFPDGRFVPRWTRWLVGASVAAYALLSLLHNSPLGLEPWPPMLDLLVPLIVFGSAVGVQIYRYRRVSGPHQRHQAKWVVFSTVMALSGFLALILLVSLFSPREGPLSDLAMNTLISLLFVPIPVSIGIAILRNRLWDIDLVINRALVYGALTASVVGIYVLMVGGLGALLQARSNLLISLLGAGLVAVLFAPLRDRLQRGVNRLMYGERDDPYAVLSRLGRRLEATLEPRAVLPAIVETVAQALKLPYAAIALKEKAEHGEFTLAAAWGSPVDSPVCLPLVYQHETVGQLLLAPRAGEEEFSPADRRLLEGLARQAGIAAHSVRLTTALQRARERLVSAREEERRRLRRDLHDGLGPQLSSQTLTIDAVRMLMKRDPDAAEALLLDLKTQAQDAIADIRRSVYALRPPALDDLGLVGALRESAAQYSQNGLHISVDAPEPLPPLPAAVEVAVYRIAREALTNVARHAEAHTCAVSLAIDDAASALRLEIRDDGRGIEKNQVAGVGLTSMRERASELGGSLIVEPLPEGGTVVRAGLPLAGER